MAAGRQVESRVQRVGARPPPRADAVGAGAARAGAAGAAGAARLAGVAVPLVPVPLVLPAARGGGDIPNLGSRPFKLRKVQSRLYQQKQKD